MTSTHKPLGVGIIGFGFMGKTHTYAYRTLPFYYDPLPLPFKLTAVCRANAALAEAARITGGFERVAATPEQLIKSPDIDIVHICTPNDQHLPALRLALAANKHIYIDKPVTASLAEADALEPLLQTYRGIAQVALQYRCFPATLRARQLVEQGFFGRITHFRAAYLHSGSLDENRPASWKFLNAAGGGVIRDLGPHVLDLLDWLIGPFTEVYCHSRIWASQRPHPDQPGVMLSVDAEDAAVMLLKSADGAFGAIEVSKLATGTEDELRFEIHGRNGALRFNLMDPNFLEVYDARLPDGDLGASRGWQRLACVQKYPPPGGKFPPGKNTLGWLRAHVHSIHAFLIAIASNRPASPSLAHGLRLQRMLEAARQSAQKQAWVSLP